MQGSVFFCPQQVTANRRIFFAGTCVNQQALPFFESDKAATKYAIQQSGKSPKDVAHALWPNKTVERAQTDLLNALNENRESQLSTDEHIFIANLCGQYDWLYFACHRCSHSRPVAQTPDEQKAQVEAAILETVDRMERLVKDFKAISPTKVRAR